MKFKPPKDIYQFWLAPHCGPGTLDKDEICGFCGETHEDCAGEFSDKIQDHPDWVHDGNLLGDGQDDPEDKMACGGSGFWCSGCGRFWAQDTCGNHTAQDHLASDEQELVLTDSSIHCVCGKKLMRQRKWE